LLKLKAWDDKSQTINNYFKHTNWKVSATNKEEVLESNDLLFHEFSHISSLIDPLEADDFNHLYFTENDVILDEINQAYVTNVAMFENNQRDELTDDTLD